MNRIFKKKIFVFYPAIILLVLIFVCFTGELLIRFFKPVPSLYPRWEYSPEFGHLLYKNVTMVHETPGKWRFTYKINEYRYRGTLIPVSNSYKKDNIIILGDSNSFGISVNTGEEYSAVMMDHLKGKKNVINLAVGGYGLTQEIRRYYEFGQLYQPSIVILQFAGNDVTNNFYTPVTEIKEGRFVFKNIHRSEGWLKKILSKSLIQKSQLYNFFRHDAYLFLKKRFLTLKDGKNGSKNRASGKKAEVQEKFYNSLLEVFAKDLWEKGVHLIIFSVYDNNFLEKFTFFPEIKQKVVELNAKGQLDYIDITEWFEKKEKYPRSPEGHPWGKEAHKRLGIKLAEYIQNL